MLNVTAAGFVPQYGKDPAAELKRALDLVKNTAVDESGTRVDYGALKHSPAYEQYRNTLSPGLAGFDPTTLKSRDERLAFWINLYNALVIDAVIAMGIRHSVIEGKLGLLTFFRRAAYNVGGYRISLDEIENGILRGNRGHPYSPSRQFAAGDPRLEWIIKPPEPRIHIALNCASRSCPPFQVYTADQIETQLDLATRNFIDTNILLNPAKQLLVVSSIFQWFKGDFDGQDGIISFIIDHLPYDGRRAWLTRYKDIIRIHYKPYDWRLNAI
ncbi:MAG: DUF547 domain-containing protein [Anaerolineales bacterium]|nr:DUF547 domain-containing protein [Anaerolineales bacterium]